MTRTQLNNHASRMMRIAATIAVTLFVLPSASYGGKKAAKPNAHMMDKAAMAKMIEKGSPGAQHKRLQALVGKFKYTAKFWMMPGAKPQTTKGASDNRWVLGGRFVMQSVAGKWAGNPFNGTGYIGFDKVKNKYVSIWMDNMSTGIMQGEGKFIAAKKTIALEGQFSCVMTGADRWFKSETKIISAKRHRYIAYHKGPDGKPFKTMEIDYVRVK